MFDNKNTPGEDPTERTVDCSDEDESGAAFLIRILQYLETPQYLRKTLFPKHSSLRFVVRVVLKLANYLTGLCIYCGCYLTVSLGALSNLGCCLKFQQGLLPPLDAPHHLRRHEWAPYREGAPFTNAFTIMKRTLVLLI